MSQESQSTSEIKPAPVTQILNDGRYAVRCPHCGDEHAHGASLGYRVSHCEEQAPQYEITDPEGVINE